MDRNFLLSLFIWTMVVSLFIPDGVFAPPSPPMNGTIVGNPTGYCFPSCTCQMGNRYFGLGERWTDPGDPCTVHQCEKNGNINSIYHGCLYKGVCKDVNTTWLDDCISYECLQGQSKAFYTLTGAGCRSQDGTCKKVGEISFEGCDTKQCEIVKGSLKMQIISTGCNVDGVCRAVNSFWHNGCSIYTCLRQDGVAVEKALAQEKMYWPSGNYILFKPKSGCPIDNYSYWAEGYRKHYSIGQNYFPVQPRLAGQFKPDFYAYEFCSHKTGGNQSSNIRRYDTYWEPGQYCIFRSEGYCPRGFENGYLLIDDHDAKSHLAVQQGSIPDGTYDPDTSFFVCCRSDGTVTNEIVLPKENSFLLLMGGGTSQCQSVKGMTSSIEKYTIDGSLFSNHDMNGSLPSLHIENGDITLSVCLYEPKQCGCPDGVGGYIPLHSNRTSNCIQRKCVSRNESQDLQIIKGGCELKGQCHDESTSWTDFDGESCIKQTCTGSTTVNGTQFIVEDIFYGCSDGEGCIPVGTVIYSDCATRVCTKDEQRNKPYLKTIQSDCPWLGSCQAVNSTWTHRCISYKCDNIFVNQEYQEWSIDPYEYGCSDRHGNCYRIGEHVHSLCYEAVCRLSNNKSMVYMDVKNGGCLWKDICKKANETWQDGCHSFQCQWMNSETETGYTAVINATSVSCEWNGGCYAADQVWEVDCIKYKCHVQKHAEEVVWNVETPVLGCRDFKGGCVVLGNTTVDRCVTYECKKWGNRLGMDAVSVGCQWKGKCWPENSTWPDKRKCVTYQCRKTRSKKPSMQISVKSYGCSFNGTCKDVNATWPDGCRTRKCVVTRTKKMITRSIAPITAGCDDQGLCRPIGYKKVSNSCMEYECLFNEEMKDAFFTLALGACRSLDNKCHPVNSTWVDMTSEMCLNYECRREPIGFLSKMIEQQCRDADGVCRSIGAQGFPASLNGTLQSDCKCVRNFDTKAGIAIQCKPWK